MDARPEWLTPTLFPYESRFLELDGHRIHYVDEGSGPTLLMLHGNPTWSFVWRHLIAKLKGRFRCVALDYPGFGLSVAAEGYDLLPQSHSRVVERFVERLELRSFVPVMQDWGGPIGLGLAGRRPELIEGLVIGNTWAWPVHDDPHFVRFSGLMGGALGGFAIRHFNAFVNLMIPKGMTRRKLASDEMAAYRKPMETKARREATHVFPREIVQSRAYLAEVETNLERLSNRRVLLCWGDRDIAFRPKELARFQAIFPRAVTVPLPGAGHYVQEDSPDEIAEAIVTWSKERES